MIYDVKRLSKRDFLINDSIKVNNLQFEEEGISYTLDFNENDITESEAKDLVEDFLLDVIKKHISKNNSSN